MLKEGTYSARARGMAGFVGVTLTVADNKISTVDLDLSTETPQYGQKAEKTLKQEILDLTPQYAHLVRANQGA